MDRPATPTDRDRRTVAAAAEQPASITTRRTSISTAGTSAPASRSEPSTPGSAPHWRWVTAQAPPLPLQERQGGLAGPVPPHGGGEKFQCIAALDHTGPGHGEDRKSGVEGKSVD